MRDGEHHPIQTVWRSRGGLQWELLATGDLFDLGPCLEGCPRLYALAAGSAGIGILGTVVTDENGGSSRYRWWFSRDGIQWQRSPQRTFSPGDGADVYVSDVVAGGPGFVAVGEVCDPTCRGTTWTSDDGRTWTERSPLPVSAHPLQVVVHGNVIVLGYLGCEDGNCQAGCEEGNCQAVWASGDLRTWSEHLIDGVNLRLVHGDGPPLLVGFANGRFAAWTSVDGATWELRPSVHPEGLEHCGFADLASRPGSAILIGQDCHHEWISEGT